MQVQFMKKTSDYRRLRSLGKVYHSKFFVIQHINKISDSPLIGITASKKVGNSVKRHRAKRRAREILRLWMNDLDSSAITFPCDMVLILRQTVAFSPFSNIQQDWYSAVNIISAEYN